MSVRVGVIGTGIMGADHAMTLQRFVSGADVTLLADLDLARAQSVAKSFGDGMRAVDDPYALIRDPEVDAVVIASHDSTHAEFTLASIDAGKPVMCEKPLAQTVAGGERIVHAEADAGRRLVCVGFMRRFDPGYLELRSAIEARNFGPPVLVHCSSRGVTAGPGATSEVSVTQSAIHEFDIVPWLLGSPITEVSWHAPRRTSQADEQLQDPQLMLLRTADGVLTTVEVFLNARYGYDIRCEVVGESGAASIAEPARLVNDLELRHATTYARDWRPRFAEAYRLELQAWIDAIANGDEPTLASAHDGLVAIAVAEAVIESMRDGGRPVAVPPVPEVAAPSAESERW